MPSLYENNSEFGAQEVNIKVSMDLISWIMDHYQSVKPAWINEPHFQVDKSSQNQVWEPKSWIWYEIEIGEQLKRLDLRDDQVYNLI